MVFSIRSERSKDVGQKRVGESWGEGRKNSLYLEYHIIFSGRGNFTLQIDRNFKGKVIRKLEEERRVV